MAIQKPVRCPSCHREVSWEGNPHRPFCSERCRVVDLGNWAAERYRVGGESLDADDEAEEDPGGNGAERDS